MELRKLPGRALLVLGSPATLVLRHCEKPLVVDPGASRERGRGLRELLGDTRALVTHGHADHHAALPGLSPVETLVPLEDAGMVARGRLASKQTYGLPLEASLLLIGSGDWGKVTPFIPPLEECGASAFPLPGHTFGQVGVRYRGVLYVADAMFGERVLEKYGVPYHADVELALQSLDRILEEVREGFTHLVMGHGPIVRSRADAERLVEANRRRVERVVELVRARLGRPSTLGELAAGVLADLGVKPTPTAILLAIHPVASIVARLADEGRVVARAGEKGVLWAWA